jgi:DNA polymerase III delta prime subunit
MNCLTLSLSSEVIGILSAKDGKSIGPRSLRKCLHGRDAPHGTELDSNVMNQMAHEGITPTEILRRSIENDRVHSAYLLTGSGRIPTETAKEFARALVCQAGTGVVCEECVACHRSRGERRDGAKEDPIVLDGKGKRGPTFRHIGDHPDLLWIERGRDDTRITIRQIRDLQAALRLGANEGGRRVAVIDGAEWLNPQAQNALLRLLEEPPPATTLMLVASQPSAIIPTIRSRSIRIRFPTDSGLGIRDPEVPETVAEIVATLDGLRSRSVGEILDFAEQYRGTRAVAAETVTELIDVSAEWLSDDVKARVALGEKPTTRELDAHRSLQQLRRDLVQRNANPQMIAERLLLGLRDVMAG